MRIERAVPSLLLVTALTGCTPNSAPDGIQNPLPSSPASSSEMMPAPESSIPSGQSLPELFVADTPQIPTGGRWVDIKPSPDHPTGRCIIDMRHVLDGDLIKATRGTLGGTLCNINSQPKPGELPKNYNQVLEMYRSGWDKILADADKAVKDGQHESTVVVRRFTWAARIGSLTVTPDKSIETNYYNTDKRYGPDACSIGQSEVAETGLTPIRLYGKIATSYELSYYVASTNTQSRGARCHADDIILLTALDGGGLTTPAQAEKRLEEL